MSNLQQLNDRLAALENETSKEIANRLKANDGRAREAQKEQEAAPEEEK